MSRNWKIVLVAVLVVLISSGCGAKEPKMTAAEWEVANATPTPDAIATQVAKNSSMLEELIQSEEQETLECPDPEQKCPTDTPVPTDTPTSTATPVPTATATTAAPTSTPANWANPPTPSVEEPVQLRDMQDGLNYPAKVKYSLNGAFYCAAVARGASMPTGYGHIERWPVEPGDGNYLHEGDYAMASFCSDDPVTKHFAPKGTTWTTGLIEVDGFKPTNFPLVVD